jgi:hypothetical protein
MDGELMKDLRGKQLHENGKMIQQQFCFQHCFDSKRREGFALWYSDSTWGKNHARPAIPQSRISISIQMRSELLSSTPQRNSPARA